MGNKRIVNGVGLLLALVLLATSIPFSIFHNHHHQPVCDVALDIPVQFKAEQDHAKQHLHTYEAKCFVCNSIFVHLAVLPNAYAVNVLLQSTSLKVSHYGYYNFQAFKSFQNKAPPIAIAG